MVSATRIWVAYCVGYAAALVFAGVVVHFLNEMNNGLVEVPYLQGLLLIIVGCVAVFWLGFEPITQIALGSRYWVVGMLFVGLVVVLGTQLILVGYVSLLTGQLLMIFTSFLGGRELINLEVGAER